jgi:hypothetical protein
MNRVFRAAGHCVDRLFLCLSLMGLVIGGTLFRLGRMLATEWDRLGARQWVVALVVGAWLWAVSALGLDDEL